MAFRNPFRPGTVSHAAVRHAQLSRRRALAQATAARAKAPEARRRAQRRAAGARAALRTIETRIEFRASLKKQDQKELDTFSISKQNQLIAILEKYPSLVPPEMPDPFSGSGRSAAWRLFYATRKWVIVRHGRRSEYRRFG